jgi:phosphatidylserine/phosphatidylglycerophosphate/cardiolipin synthase-like enzyme
MKLPRIVESLLFVVLFCSLLGCTTALIDYLEARGNPRKLALAGLHVFGKTDAPREFIAAPQAIFEGQKIKNTLLGLIDKAQPKDEISLTVFIMTDRDIAQALIKKHKENVKIMVVADNGHAQKEYSQVGELIKAGICVYLHNPDSTNIMHNKFWLLKLSDKQIVVTGSYNLTNSAATKNAENIVVICHPETYQEYSCHHAKLVKNSVLALAPKSKRAQTKITKEALEEILKAN